MPHLIRLLSGADEVAFLKHMESAQTPPKIRAIRKAIIGLEMGFGGKLTMPTKVEWIEGSIHRMAAKSQEYANIRVTGTDVLCELRWLRDHPDRADEYAR